MEYLAFPIIALAMIGLIWIGKKQFELLHSTEEDKK